MPKICPVCGTSYDDISVFCPRDGSSLRAADDDGELIGSVIADRYLVTGRLGEGGMGTVYLARHVRLPQQAAIKVLRRNMLRDPAAVARFNREAANASRVEHERVARVFDFGETEDGMVYLAMEYVAGRTLKDLQRETGPLPPQRAANLVRQIAEGLDAAHRIGLVHRDLKPDNVLVIEDAERGDRVKVVDFGIAKAIDGSGESGLTQTGFVVGTPEFMSPEQLLGGSIDLRSDVYALALVAYQLLTGAMPFVGDTPEATMTARLVQEPRPLREALAARAWPAEIEQVFDVALARDAAGRYASAGAFADALGDAVSAWLGTAARRTPVATAVSTATRDAASTARTSATAAAAERAEPVATTTGGSRRGLLIGGLAGAAVVVAIIAVVLSGGGASSDPAASDPVATDPSLAPTIVSAPEAGTASAVDANLVDSTGRAPVDAPTAAAGTDRRPTTPAAGTATPGGAERSGATPTRTDPPAAPAVERPSRSAPVTDAAALRTLDSLTRALDPTRATAASARRAVQSLRALLGDLRTGTDSGWALIRMTEAHLLIPDPTSACLDVSAAAPLATLPEQQRVLTRLRGMLGC